jgi:hypothetical protein
VTSTGSSAAQKLSDFSSIIDALGSDLGAPTWIMSRRDAIKIAATLISGGALQFPTVTALRIAVGNPDHRLRVDAVRRQFDSDRSPHQMDDAPTNDSGASPTETSLVALYQTNSIAYRIQREISWLKARSDAVAFVRVSY